MSRLNGHEIWFHLIKLVIAQTGVLKSLTVNVTMAHQWLVPREIDGAK